MQLTKRYREENGFSMIEVVAAAAIISATILAFSFFMVKISQEQASAHIMMVVNRTAAQEMERMKAVPWKNLCGYHGGGLRKTDQDINNEEQGYTIMDPSDPTLNEPAVGEVDPVVIKSWETNTSGGKTKRVVVDGVEMYISTVVRWSDNSKHVRCLENNARDVLENNAEDASTTSGASKDALRTVTVTVGYSDPNRECKDRCLDGVSTYRSEWS